MFVIPVTISLRETTVDVSGHPTAKDWVRRSI